MPCAISSFLKINKTKFRMVLVNLSCILDCLSCEGKNKIGGFLFFLLEDAVCMLWLGSLAASSASDYKTTS